MPNQVVVAGASTDFQNNLDPAGYAWRFNAQSPGGHLFDDMVHKYGTGMWLFDEVDITSVQAIVRQGPLFFEAPMATIWEYERQSLLGMMEVTSPPRMHIRSSFYGADEFFGDPGHRRLHLGDALAGEMLDLAPLIVFHPDGTQTAYSNLESNWLEGFKQSSKGFIDALLEGRSDPEMTPEMAIKTLQFAFAVYQASIRSRAGRPRTILESVSPPWWPPTSRTSSTTSRSTARSTRQPCVPQTWRRWWWLLLLLFPTGALDQRHVTAAVSTHRAHRRGLPRTAFRGSHDGYTGWTGWAGSSGSIAGCSTRATRRAAERLGAALARVGVGAVAGATAAPTATDAGSGRGGRRSTQSRAHEQAHQIGI